MSMKSDLVRIGRVLHEDDGFVTIEVPKDLERELKIEEGDAFLSLVFVHDVGGHLESWLPWAK